MINRRAFLTYLGTGTYALMRSTSSLAAAFPLSRAGKASARPFHPIDPSKADDLLLPTGYRYDVLASYGDALGTTGPRGKESFGYDNDFIAYFPIDALSGGKNPHHGLLWVNHEFFNPLFVSGIEREKTRSADQVRAERQTVGGSILEVSIEKGKWVHRPGSRYTKRLTADYPELKVSGPVSSLHPVMVGTLAGCSGGRTPWFTALSCEENFHLYNGMLNWAATEGMAINEDHFGWVIEVDPFGELPPTKHSALGKFAHENAAVRVGRSGRLAIYMGDDERDQYLYKFISSDTLKSKTTRADKSALLSKGTLYAADFGQGKWLPLDLARNEKLKSAGFKTQAEVLMRTREAAKAAGATPIDRPEDCEVHPLDGSVYVALTNNSSHGNFFGQIIRLVEEADDSESEKFRYEIFLAGGPQSGLSCPDNLAFDKAGNLWVGCDIPSKELNKGAYASFGNNGLFMVPTKGAHAGDAFQFASGPVDSELTGPWFNENEDTLFISVQHPGETTTDLKRPTSRWPGNQAVPRPSVVAIRGFPTKS